MLVLLIVLGGLGISFFEGISFAEGFYFTFVTAFTIGFGDIAPVTPGGRALTLLVGLIGLIFTGLIVSVATRALALTVEEVKQRGAPDL